MSTRIGRTHAIHSHGPQVPNQLDTRAANRAVKTALEAKFKSNGVVHVIGHPTVKFTSKPGVFAISGKVDVNALWGGDAKYTFNGTVNVNTGKITSLRTRIFQET